MGGDAAKRKGHRTRCNGRSVAISDSPAVGGWGGVSPGDHAGRISGEHIGEQGGRSGIGRGDPSASNAAERGAVGAGHS